MPKIIARDIGSSQSDINVTFKAELYLYADGKETYLGIFVDNADDSDCTVGFSCESREQLEEFLTDYPDLRCNSAMQFTMKICERLLYLLENCEHHVEFFTDLFDETDDNEFTLFQF